MKAWHTGDQSMTMDLEESGDADDLLADNTMDGLEAPPELPVGAVPDALPQVADTPQAMAPPAVTPYSQPRSVFPGESVARSSARVGKTKLHTWSTRHVA